jgi:superfamily I DNA/RNA helicase
MRKELGHIIGKLIALHICQDQQEAEEHPKYVSYNDKVQAIEFISRGLEKSEDVVNRIRGIFADEKEGICLSTIHKSKGLENDRVFIICEDKMPLKGCMEIPWMAVQEYNLIYVAMTRAKHFLGYIQDFC